MPVRSGSSVGLGVVWSSGHAHGAARTTYFVVTDAC
jgi:hypothetical protein